MAAHPFRRALCRWRIGIRECRTADHPMSTMRRVACCLESMRLHRSRPVSPEVTDEGALTPNSTQLAASWTSDDPQSGIREFQYAIGTTPGGTDVRPFT